MQPGSLNGREVSVRVNLVEATRFRLRGIRTKGRWCRIHQRIRVQECTGFRTELKRLEVMVPEVQVLHWFADERIWQDIQVEEAVFLRGSTFIAHQVDHGSGITGGQEIFRVQRWWQWLSAYGDAAEYADNEGNNTDIHHG